MIRISFVCVSLRGGGTERIVTRIASYLASAHEVSIITLAPREPFFSVNPDVLVKQPVWGVGKGLKLLRVFRQALHLVKSVRQLRPDLVLIFGEDIAASALVLSRVGYVSRNWVFFRGRPERSIRGMKGLLNRLICRYSSRIFIQTEEAARSLTRFYPKSKLTVWQNPIEIPNDVSSPEKRESVILNVGSIGRLKNQGCLVRVFSEISEEAKDWDLVFVGDGPDRNSLEASSKLSVAANQIHFAGEQADVFSRLNRASIFAFTSLSEGFPNALAEAMANGCACISYECPAGPAELIDHGVNGFLVEMGNEDEFSKLLLSLIKSEELRSQFSREARRSMERLRAEHVLPRLGEMISKEEEIMSRAK